MAEGIHGFHNDFTGNNQPRCDKKEITGPYNGEEDDNDERNKNQAEKESKERKNDEEKVKQNEEDKEERDGEGEGEVEGDEDAEEDDDDDDDSDDYDSDDEEEEQEQEEKKEKVEEEEGKGVVQNQRVIDRISGLPDSLILQILSSLGTEEVGRTCILSRRWQFLWTSVPNLVLYDHSSDETPNFVQRDLLFYDHNRDTTKFVERVYEALRLHEPASVKKFVVGFMYRECNASDVDFWVQFATRSKVEHLGLRLVCLIIHSTNYQLPEYVYNNASLTNLDLSFVKVLPNGSLSWTSLKSLTLEFLDLAQDTIKKILSGSPVLEFLRLSSFVGSCSEINSTSLQELEIENHYGICPRSTLDISVPNVKSLHVSGDLHGTFLQLINVSSLVSAKIDYCHVRWAGFLYRYKEMCDYIDEILVNLNHVKELELGSWCIEILSALVVEGLQHTFPTNLKALTVESHMSAESFPGLFGLLQSSPDLETLVIKRKPSIHETIPIDLELLGRCNDFWMSQGSSCSNCFQHLRIVKITSFVCPADPDELMLKFVKFLLQNARVLEKMVITVGATSKCSSCKGSPEFVDVAQKLISFPRSSPTAIIVLWP